MPPRRAVIVTPGPSPAWPSLPSTAPEITCGWGGAGGGVTPTVTTPLVRRGQGPSEQHSEGEGGREVVMGEVRCPQQMLLGWAGPRGAAVPRCLLLPGRRSSAQIKKYRKYQQAAARRATFSLAPTLEGKRRDFHVNLMLAMWGTCDVCYAVGIIVKFPCCSISLD